MEATLQLTTDEVDSDLDGLLDGSNGSRLLITRLFIKSLKKNRFLLVRLINPGVMTSSAPFRIQILSKKVPIGFKEQAQ